MDDRRGLVGCELCDSDFWIGVVGTGGVWVGIGG